MAIGRINATLSGVQPGGLAKIVPTSVAVGSGSGSVDSNGNVTFSGASSVSLNGCFTSSYQNYQIVFDYVHSNIQALNFRLRASGTDLTGAVYYSGAMTNQANASAYYGAAQFGATFADIYAGGDYRTLEVIDITQPQTTERTLLTYDAAIGFNNAVKLANAKGAVMIDNALSYDGFTIYVTNTITGTIRVYGYSQ